MAEYKKVCKVCGKEFIAFNHRAAYCSEFCKAVRYSKVSHERYIKKVMADIKEKTKECAICGKRFTATHNKKYCSERCLWEAKQVQSQRKSKPRLSATGTLCWHCRWATGKDGHCPWARSLTPVPGWVAKKVKLKISAGSYTDSYIVKECPLFEEG